jgi:hypothetical protein
MEYIISEHAKEQIEAREITFSDLLAVVKTPDQKFDFETDEAVCQSKVTFGGKIYLLRVFVNYQKNPPVIISAYRTSNINKYWRK